MRAVADERFPAGAHELPLWTRDEGGRTMAPGIYFLRMEAGAVDKDEVKAKFEAFDAQVAADGQPS